MYYNNVYFHNVRDMIKTDNGYILSRFPKEFFSSVYSPASKLSAERATGVEIRFKPISDNVTITLRLLGGETPAYADVYYGTTFMPKLSVELTNNATELTLPKRSIAEEDDGVFDTDVVRIILPDRKVELLSIYGETDYPYPNDMPKTTVYYLGAERFSEALYEHPTLSIPFIVSERMGVDYCNLSFINSNEYYSEIAEQLYIEDGVVVAEILNEELSSEDIKSVKSTAKKVNKNLALIKVDKIFIDGLYGYESDIKAKEILKAQKKLKKYFKRKLLFSGLSYFDNSSTPSSVSEIAYELVKDFNDFYSVFNPKTTFKRGKAPDYEYAKTTSNDEPILKPKVSVKTTKKYNEEE